MHRLFWLVLLGLACGCSNQEPETTGFLAKDQIDPAQVPDQLNLYQLEPVLVARFEASASGYNLTALQARAAPTSAVVKDRDVRIVAKDEQGRPLASVSVDNPREIFASGATNVARTVDARSTFTVFLPQRDLIRSLDLAVLRGPNAGLRRTFPVNPSTLPPLLALRDSRTNVVSRSSATNP